MTAAVAKAGRYAGSAAAPWYALGALLVAYVLAYIDRQVLNLLVEPIKRDLHLSDTGVSLLQGFAFALFMSVAALPVARAIDGRRRLTVLSIAVGIWSLMTIGCGASSGFLALFACRLGVGAGEAAVTPASYSLIGDWFHPRQLGRAVSVFSLGSYIGTGLSLLFGALAISLVPRGMVALPVLGSVHGWQLVFVVVGAPGLLVAAWIAGLREPPRRASKGAGAPTPAEITAWMRRHGRSVLWLDLGGGFSSMAAVSLLAWLPSFFIRSFGMTAQAAGSRLGLMLMVAGAGGALAAGVVGDRLRAHGRGLGRLPLIIGGASGAIPFMAIGPLVHSAAGSLAVLGLGFFVLTAALSSQPATLQEITPNRMLGLQHALAVLGGTTLGLGLGPTAVALITDHIVRDERKVGLALALAVPVMLALAAACFSLARDPYRRSLGEISQAPDHP
jgi:MFS family permease